MTDNRIQLNMSPQDIIMVMAGNNYGALKACMELLSKGEKVDPDALGGGLSSLLMLDTLGIYEERIYMLWNDVCKRDIVRTIAVLRAYELGGLTGVNTTTLNHAIDNRGVGIDLDAVVDAVKDSIPNFNPNFEANTQE